jgi:hypothetical protein
LGPGVADMMKAKTAIDVNHAVMREPPA